MRLLTLLSVLQITAITLLLIKLEWLENSVTDLASAQSMNLVTQTATHSPVAGQPDSGLLETRLRAIVREELATARVVSQPVQASQPSSMEAIEVPGGAPEAKDYHYRIALVSAEIDQYVSQGAISDREMSDLQGLLAGLDQSGRKQMMQKLVKALNSGELTGRF